MEHKQPMSLQVRKMSGRKRSDIWNHFICKRLLSTHRGEATAAAASISTSSTSSGPQTTAAAATLARDSAISSTQAAPTTTTQAAFGPRRPQQTLWGTYITRPMDPLRQSKLDEALVKMIVSDYQPFSIVRTKASKNL